APRDRDRRRAHREPAAHALHDAGRVSLSRPPASLGRAPADRALPADTRGPPGLMRDGTPSATAERAAVMRAVHHRPDRPRVLDDPIAIRLLEAATATAVETDLARYDTLPLRRLRATIAFRSRYAEDALRDAVDRGVARYVVLGAGLDTFAYRSP